MFEFKHCTKEVQSRNYKKAGHVVQTNIPHDAFEIDLHHRHHFSEYGHKSCWCPVYLDEFTTYCGFPDLELVVEPCKVGFVVLSSLTKALRPSW